MCKYDETVSVNILPGSFKMPKEIKVSLNRIWRVLSVAICVANMSWTIRFKVKLIDVSNF